MIFFNYNNFLIIIFKRIKNIFNYYILLNTIKMTILIYLIYLIDILTKKKYIKQVKNEINSLFYILNIFLLPILILRLFHSYNLWYKHINNVLISRALLLRSFLKTEKVFQ